MESRTWNLLALAVGVVVLTVVSPWLWREFRDLPGQRALAARAAERAVTLEVGGMTCPACVAKVRAELATVPGVSAVDVRLTDERAYVMCARDLPDSALVSAVARAGPGFRAFVAVR